MRDAIAQELGGETLVGARFDRMVSIAREVLPGTIPGRAIEDTFRVLAGKPLDPVTLDATCWRAAGNMPVLRRGKGVLPWRVQRYYEWVPLQILGCRQSRGPRERIGARYSFRVMAGTPCPLVLTKWWSREFCRFRANDFGFSRPARGSQPASHPYAAQDQLVGLRVYALIEPKLCAQEPGFRALGWPPSVHDWNLELIRRRLRVDPGYTCPKKLPATFPCHKCPAGYISCPAGTHRQNWVQKPCEACQRPLAWFDPETAADVCVDCTVKAVYRRT